VVGRAELIDGGTNDDGGSMLDIRLVGTQNRISTIVIYTTFADNTLTTTQQRKGHMLNHGKLLVASIFDKTVAIAGMPCAA
jgi:hypothetical protein